VSINHTISRVYKASSLVADESQDQRSGIKGFHAFKAVIPAPLEDLPLAAIPPLSPLNGKTGASPTSELSRSSSRRLHDVELRREGGPVGEVSARRRIICLSFDSDMDGLTGRVSARRGTVLGSNEFPAAAAVEDLLIVVACPLSTAGFRGTGGGAGLRDAVPGD